MRIVYTILCALVLTLGMNSRAIAQNTEPCAKYVQTKWHNSLDVRVDLTILDAKCKFTMVARGVSFEGTFAFGKAPLRTDGEGYFIKGGELILLFYPNKPNDGHFKLRWMPEKVLNPQQVVPEKFIGTVSTPEAPPFFKGPHPITLSRIKDFPP